MENKKTIDQNPGETVNPEENINAVEETAKKDDRSHEEQGISTVEPSTA